MNDHRHHRDHRSAAGESHGVHAASPARALSVATVANMKRNRGFAFICNALGMPLAAAVLRALTGWLLSSMIDALATSVSSASVIFNALRLRRSGAVD